MSVRTDFITTSVFEILQQGIAAADSGLSVTISVP